MSDETTSVILRSGDSLCCGELFIERRRSSLVVEGIVLPEPGAGIGGVELVVSPDQRYAVLFIYSGQGEAGYELFELEPKLRHVGGLPYVIAEGVAPVFSPDSRWIAMASTRSWVVRETGEDAESALDSDDEGEVVIDWATLHWQAVPSGPVEHVAIGTKVPRSMSYDDLYEWNLYEPLEFVGPSRVAILLPWGDRLELDVPATAPVTTP